MLYWGILFTSIFLFTVFTSVYLLNRVRKNKYMVKTLFNRSNTSRILTFDNISNLLW